MSEKKKFVDSDKKSTETEKQFLERSNVRHIIKDVLNKVLSNRPEEPIGFIAEYFDSLEDKLSLVLKAHKELSHTHHSRPVFDHNIRTAYGILCHHKVKKQLRGVNGAVFTDLLSLLCRNLPQSVSTQVLKRLHVYEFESVPFAVFRGAVLACAVLEDFSSLAGSLYKSLDIQLCNKADRVLCEVLLGQLTLTVSSNQDGNNVNVIECGYNLGPDKIAEAFEKAMDARSSTYSTMSHDEFVTDACEIFLTKVKPAR